MGDSTLVNSLGRRIVQRNATIAFLAGCLFSLLTSSVGAVQLGEADESGIRFDRDVRPILSAHCFACHGFDEQARQANLRLDIADAGLDRVVIAGQPADSVLFQRISTSDPDQKMPPPDSHLELKQEQIETIERWIETGAVYAQHWSLSPPQRPAVPQLSDELRPVEGNEIDRFVRKRLAEQGLSPAPPADRYVLIRRVYLDLLGLPPSADEVREFVNDPDPKAYPKLVQRLLDSPHFGERMALDWLDAARYADTNGYSIDGGRHAWLWRDWVIQAFNDNLPYDQFLREQLAGDLLPDPTDSQLIATAFQRNNMVTHEGGTIPEENLANYNADRIRTFGEAVLGLTLACAQCHDHKYDPVTQEEYYRLTAFFNTLDDRGLDGDGGVNPAPSINVKTVLQAEPVETIEARIAELEKELATRNDAMLQRWEDQQRQRLSLRGQNFKLHPVEVLNITTPNMGSGFAVEGINGVRITSFGGLSAFDMSLKLPEIDEPICGVRVTFHPVDDLPGKGWGRGIRKLKVDGEEVEKGTFVLTGFSVTADRVRSEQVNLYQLAGIESVSASSWEEQFPPAATLDPRNPTGWSPELSSEGPVRFTITLQTPIEPREYPYLTLQLNFGYGQSMLPGKFDIAVFNGLDDDIDLSQDIETILSQPKDQRTDEQQSALWNVCAEKTDELEDQRISLAILRERRSVLTDKFNVMVMREAKEPRKTFVFNRGDYSQPLQQVEPGVPASLPPLPSETSANRQGLAEWVTMPSNPLTARVAVNRFWQILFGRGIVSTASDFGSQGSWPSHPELLDWLAVEFQESGWDVKRLFFQIATSATYQQSSHCDVESLKRDPENVWLARGARFRLSAELIRDNALKVSGLLVPRIGGPSVNPYTPGDPWREVSHYGSTPATAQVFVQDHGEKLYRRSMYTYWKRTAPPTNLTIFDAPNREVCTITRASTNTPLQALVLLNDVQFVEGSRAFAERILQNGESDQQRLEWAYYESLGRPIAESEQGILLHSLERERERYRAKPNLARAYLRNGESKRDESLDPIEHAAWGAVAAVILNQSEFVTRH
jgi:hypothetical protein